jgi:hypothetical protein
MVGMVFKVVIIEDQAQIKGNKPSEFTLINPKDMCQDTVTIY